MGYQAVIICISAVVAAFATMAYTIFQQRRYLTNNTNAIGVAFTVYRNDQCLICLCEIMEQDQVVLNCGHLLHQSCLLSMERARGTFKTNRCPICRTPIRLE